MTDLEKAIELSNKFKCITIGERCKNIEDACYKMAKWKDEQFSIERKQLIEKANEFIAEWFYEHPHAPMVCSDEFETVDKLLDRFKKAMEGGEE